MNRDSTLARATARVLLTTAFALASSAAAGASAQDKAPAANEATAADTAAPAEQSRRSRRRDADADADAEAPVQAAAIAATAAEPAAAAQQAETVEARMVCKNIKLTGTKISKRICGTEEQWANTDRKTSGNAEETMRQVRQQTGVIGTQSGTPGPGGFGAAN